MGLDVSSKIMLGVRADDYYKYEESTTKEKRKTSSGSIQTIETTTVIEMFGNRSFNHEEDEFYEFTEENNLEHDDCGIIGIEILSTSSHRSYDGTIEEIDVKELSNQEREMQFAEVLEKVGIPRDKMKYYLLTNVSY